jgi:oxalate decarboxylase/phosphoglucose isomerase-like protein (cupin superfamily)
VAPFTIEHHHRGPASSCSPENTTATLSFCSTATATGSVSPSVIKTPGHEHQKEKEKKQNLFVCHGTADAHAKFQSFKTARHSLMGGA